MPSAFSDTRVPRAPVTDSGAERENHTSRPLPGDILFYPGGISEPEILVPYGTASFASKVGPLAGNHFLSIVEGQEDLARFGHKVLWEGAQDILFELRDEPAV